MAAARIPATGRLDPAPRSHCYIGLVAVRTSQFGGPSLEAIMSWKRSSLTLSLVAAIMAIVMTTALAAPASGRSAERESWPRTVRADRTAHYISVDGALKPPGPQWIPSLRILTGGDQPTEQVNVNGRAAVKVAGYKFNTADDQYPVWASEHTIDILVEFYGDGAFLNADGSPRYFNFLTGTLPDPIAVDGGVIPAEAKNGRWNWALFRIPNGLRHMDGGRLVGTINPRASSDPAIAAVSRLSGQNGGTIRLDGLPGLIVRVVAFGQRGAFGEPDHVNRFRRK